MLHQTLCHVSMPVMLIALIGACLGPCVASAEAGQSPDDRASIACNEFLRIKGGQGGSPGVDSLDVSTDCDRYHIYLSNHPTDRSQSTLRISERGTTGFMTYHLADMPLNVPVLLLTPERRPTRVLARRQVDHVNIIVSRKPFQEPPPSSLLPRSSSMTQRPIGPPSSRGADAAADRAAALIGKWATGGAYLEMRHDGTFSTVSHSAPGVFGGVLDDQGKYEVRENQIIFHGMLRERTCAFSFTSQNELRLCEVAYHPE